MSQLPSRGFRRRGRLLLSLNFLIACVMVSFCFLLVDVVRSSYRDPVGLADRNPPSLLNPPPDQASPPF